MNLGKRVIHNYVGTGCKCGYYLCDFLQRSKVKRKIAFYHPLNTVVSAKDGKCIVKGDFYGHVVNSANNMF